MTQRLMTMINFFIKFILVFLIVFTPIAFGSVELWAFSLMELGILLIIILWALQGMIIRTPVGNGLKPFPTGPRTSYTAISHLPSAIPMVLLSIFLLLILFQMLPFPSGLLKIISPKTFEIRHQLLMTNNQLPMTTLSFVPFVTQINFFKWLTLIGLFVFLHYWKPFGNNSKVRRQLIIVIFAVGVWESLYGIFEYFSGHGQILNLEGEDLVHSVTGTFVNRNCFAGYLLMVIPLSLGYIFSREAARDAVSKGWRNRLASLDGKSLLLGFGIIVMMLGLIFSASRMGISSLLLSFTLLSFLLGNPRSEKKFSKTSVLIFGLALLWAIWIGLDTVISRFFSSTDDFRFRWAMWVDTFKILKDFPLFGSGLGTFTYIFPMYRSIHILGLATHAENDLLQLASEVGLIGVGLLLILFFYLFFKVISAIRSLSHGEPGRYIGIGALVGILALMFHSLVEKNIQVSSNAFLYTFIWALVLRTGVANKGKA